MKSDGGEASTEFRGEEGPTSHLPSWEGNSSREGGGNPNKYGCKGKFLWASRITRPIAKKKKLVRAG